jgi:predicted MPP superfamily phosphohydrolase
MPDQILILHLSDLHFGAHSRFSSDLDKLASMFNAAIGESKNELSIDTKINLIIVTGDIVESGLTEEFNIAKKFFDQISEKLKLSHKYFIFIRGNHDICWDDSKRAVSEQVGSDENEQDKRINKYKFEKFEKFREEFCGEQTNSNRLKHDGFIYDFDDLKVSIAALNSCEIESHRDEDHRGVLSIDQAQSAMDYWRAKDYGGWIKIIAIHHNPEPPKERNRQKWITYLVEQGTKGLLNAEQIRRYESDILGLEGKEHLRRLATGCQVHLVLNGHQHITKEDSWPLENVKGHIEVLSAGSFGLDTDKMPNEYRNSFRLIFLDLANKRLKSVIRVYEPMASAPGLIDPGHFVSNPVSQGTIYEQDLVISERLGCRTLVPGEDPIIAKTYNCDMQLVNANTSSTMPFSDFKKLDNPYISGIPLQEKTELFVGRDNIMKEIIRRVRRHPNKKEESNLVVLYGPRRSGKTSILKQLRFIFDNSLEPIYIDLDSLTLVSEPSPSRLLEAIARIIIDEVYVNRGIKINLPSQNEFNEDAFSAITNIIKDVISTYKPKNPVLMFDECDILSHFSKDIQNRQKLIDSLRSLIGHYRNAFFIFIFLDINWKKDFALARLLTLAGKSLWVGLLPEKEARDELILKPIDGYFTYEEDILDRLIKLSGIHPSFLQLVCGEAVDWRNEKKKNSIPIGAMKEIIGKTIEVGDPQFKGLWKYLDRDERTILYALSYISKDEGKDGASLEEIKTKQLRLSIYGDDFTSALMHLEEIGLIYEQNSYFYLHLELIKYWIYKTPKRYLFPEKDNRTGDELS